MTKLCFRRKWSFPINFGYPAKSFSCLRKNPRQVCHNYILLVYWNLVGRRILLWKFLEFLCHFQTLSRQFCFSSNSFTRGCQNCVVRVQKIFLKRYRPSQKTPSFIILYIVWKVCGLQAAIAQKGYQNWNLHVYCKPVKRFFGKNIIKV